MTGAAIEIDLDHATDALGRLNDEELSRIAYEIGSLIEDQTKIRIADEKTSPEGERWAPWSEAYDETRNHAKHSLLVGEDNLRDSIQNYTTGLAAVVGTNLIYGAIQNFGGGRSKADGAADIPAGAVGAGIPARPYLGLSADNRRAIEELVVGRLEDLLQ